MHDGNFKVGLENIQEGKFSGHFAEAKFLHGQNMSVFWRRTLLSSK